MKLLAIVGAARVGGNTDLFTDAFLKGVREQGVEVRKIHLGQLELKPCMGCNGCAQGTGCVQNDDMKQVLDALQECDIVALATPLYFWNISAQLKLVIDRMYALGKASPRGYYEYPQKKCVLLATCADSDSHFWPFELVEQYYHRMVRYLRWTDLGMLTAGGCGGTVVPRCIHKTNHLQRAYEFGQSLKLD